MYSEDEPDAAAFDDSAIVLVDLVSEEGHDVKQSEARRGRAEVVMDLVSDSESSKKPRVEQKKQEKQSRIRRSFNIEKGKFYMCKHAAGRFLEQLSSSTLAERVAKFLRLGNRRLVVRAESITSDDKVNARLFLQADQTGRVPSGLRFPQFESEYDELFETTVLLKISPADLSPAPTNLTFQNVRN